MSGDPLIIHLVHGTFDSQPKWAREDAYFPSRLANSLGGARFAPYDWSGLNSHEERKKGGAGFRLHLNDWISENPSAHHVIIGHSHGGMVALYALKNWAEDAPLSSAMRDGRVHLITLGTPFLTVKPCLLSISVFLLAIGVTVIAVVGLFVLGWIARLIGGLLPEALHEPLVVLILFPLLACGVMGVTWIGPSMVNYLSSRVRREQESASQDFGFVHQLHVPTLCMMAQRDEALFGIRIAQWAPGVALWLKRLVVILTLAGTILFVVFPSSIEWLPWKLNDEIGPFNALLGPLLLPAIVLLYLAFPVATARSGIMGFAGWERPVFNLACKVRVTSEPVWIADAFRTLKVCNFSGEEPIDGEKRRRHCSFMHFPSSIAAMASWISESVAGRTVAHFARRHRGSEGTSER